MDTEDRLLIPVKEAARQLSITPWSMYKLLDSGAVEGVYQGRRRYVNVPSLKQYAADLPNTAPDTAAS